MLDQNDMEKIADMVAERLQQNNSTANENNANSLVAEIDAMLESREQKKAEAKAIEAEKMAIRNNFKARMRASGRLNTEPNPIFGYGR